MVEKGEEYSPTGKLSGEHTAIAYSQISVTEVGREHLSDALRPHESYEGLHRYDPGATWTEQEERTVVRKTDFFLLSWICFMVKETVNK